MWKDSNELLRHALRELETAIKENKCEVKIVLNDFFSGDMNKMSEYADELKIKTNTEMIRKEFSDYNIKSVVSKEGNLKAGISFSKGPCSLFYPLVWTLKLEKKAN